MPSGHDENAPVVRQREILHLPKAKLNGTGVVRAPSGELRRDEIMREQGIPPEPAEKE